jgi:peptidoglycan-associated lipoprotein
VLGTEFGLVPLLESVHFAPNMSELSEPARAALKKNAAVLKAVLAESPGVLIRVEGHCDERNTLEYNLALGQRRANSVKNYYSALGVKKGAVSTVSYGEERPVCRESYEGCWGRNRRADTALRSPSGPVKLSKKKLSAIR